MARHLHSRSSRILTLLIAAIAAFVISLTLCSAPSPTPELTPGASTASRRLETPAVRVQRTLVPYVLEGYGNDDAAVLTDMAATLPAATRCVTPLANPNGGWSRPKSPDWTREDRARTRKQIDLIAREMGVDRTTRRLLVRWAVRESVGAKPWQIHVHPRDVAAASSPGARARVAAMGREFGPAWTYGRGLYGMQPSLYLARWDSEASLDVLCDPVVATIVAVWAARDQASQCRRRGYTMSLLTANRRWATGHCAPRAKDEKTREWWGSRGRDVDAPARWGKRWPESSDREEIYHHMREKIHAAGLDSSDDSG